MGFSVAFLYGEPPFYGQVFRDGARLNLRCSPGPLSTHSFVTASIFFRHRSTLDDAKPLFLEYQAAGVPFAQALKTQPWGARTFIVRDPDGNLILFAGRGE